VRTAALIIAATALGTAPALAQSTPEGLQPAPEPPEIPTQVENGETIEPDVRIVRGVERTVTEYRVNGQLRAIRVEPSVGAPYYLVDADGDGSLETRSRGLGPNFLIPQWVLLSW